MTGTERAEPSDVREPDAAGVALAEPAADDEAVTPAEPGEMPPTHWRRHPNGRWIVGDPGNQPAVVATPAVLVRRRPDLAVDGCRVGSLDYRAASLRGLSHLETGKPRQDSYAVAVTRDGHWLVGCVADGVSAGKLSHRAADLACEKIVSELIDGLAEAGIEADLGKLRWDAAVDSANDAIKNEFLRTLRSSRNQQQEIEADEVTLADVRQHMSSTAVAFVVATHPGPDGTHRSLVTAIAGDSSALLLRDGAWSPVTAVKGAGDEVASSEVRPLPRVVTPEPNAIQLRPGDVLAVISDGIGDPMGSGGGVVGRFLAEQWTSPPDTIEFAHQVGFYRRTFVDDRTAVAVWTAAEP
ncbi:protein phosphatase 2C domain-containing protein [Asanoa siamensis]|uniref:PPM-type phosphatase domain-containing protein n=1 Tax=Asanoa siamensis TaxID=926357 RepID=A0ABQ4CR78_9ACTN|nr:protein phosphatase 2C domain-containing protein [Asanoa siamensis]GIF73798.1 hypothetical protein Asi02nite_33160 [Asanoa siamensis]